MQIPSFAHQLPHAFQAEFARHWEEFKTVLNPHQVATLARICRNEALLQQLARVWSGSEYVRLQMVHDPDLFFDLVAEGDLYRSYQENSYQQLLENSLARVENETQLMWVLRQHRQREMVRLIWREQLELVSIEESTRDLSNLADACVSLALDWLYQDACKTLGVPMSGCDQPRPQQMVVLGMGKLGARELNLSSDIDLIFAFPEQGQTQGASRSLENQQFFNRLGQRLIRVLDERTADGFVFRVDMRLRPYGQSGALTFCFDALSQYYQSQGRDWERYAMIKARIVAGDVRAGQRLLAELKPFVFRRYLDFGAFAALREMKARILKEERRRGWESNIKLGRGGIREIEFIAQMFQLVYGGREPTLQQRNLKMVLGELGTLGMLPSVVAEQLYRDYRFLRRLEHALQAVRDQQTQTLPIDSHEQERVALAMGFDNWPALLVKLDQARERVGDQFNRLISAAEEDVESGEESFDWSDCWPPRDETLVSRQLEKAGFDQPEKAAERLHILFTQPAVQVSSAVGRDRLDRFIPLLLTALAGLDKPTLALERVLVLVELVLRRSAYLVLLSESPQALQQLVVLSSTSAWIANELAQYPVLLDELRDAGHLYEASTKEDMRADLQRLMISIPVDDLEQQMDALRHFRRSQVLRVAAADVMGHRPLMKVSDSLTEIAELVLEQVLQMAWQYVSSQYGEPLDAQGQALTDSFIIVAYGKLGGRELGYSSDLDLVFIYDAPPEQLTSGEKAIENGAFFTRLGKRIVHILTTYTYSGQLYDVDMRLRPSGNSGLLVTSLAAFKHYQEKLAWVWEHQALVRARVVAGTTGLADKFEQLRQVTLCAERACADLKTEVTNMRQKILVAHGKEDQKKGIIDLKYDRGGVVDIEFIVQYAVLAWSQHHPQLLVYTDNIRILEALVSESLMSEEDAMTLRNAYILFRSQLHQRSITEQASAIDLSAGDELQISEIQEARTAVYAIWQKLLVTA